MITQQKQKSVQKSAKKPISNYLEKISENLNANSNLKKAISEINSLIKAADCLKNEYEIYVIDQNNSASKVALEICPSAKQNNNKLSAKAKQASKAVANAKQNKAKQPLVSALKKAASKLAPLSKEQQNNKKSVNQNKNNKKALLLGKTVQSKIINKTSANSVNNKKNNNKIKSK